MSGTQSVADTVAVFDNSFNQLFAAARPINADVTPTAKVMKHPLESGGSIVDNRIIEPLKIDVNFVLTPETFVDTYNEINQVFLGSDTVQVQTKTGLYPNMLIASMPHKEDVSHFDTIMITLKFEEAKFVSSSTSALPPSATTSNGGNLNGQTASATETSQANDKAANSSTAYSIGKYFGAFN